MAKAMQKKKNILKTVDKNADIPASHGQLQEVRSELKSDIASLRLEMNSRFKSVDSRFTSIDSKLDKLSSEIKDISAFAHRSLAISEEQNTRNQYVFDGFKALLDGQKHLENRVLKIEKNSFGGSGL